MSDSAPLWVLFGFVFGAGLALIGAMIVPEFWIKRKGK